MDEYIVRRLTPLECCRLQGFPDDWTDGVPGSDSAQYRMWGNGMTLQVIQYAMEGMDDALKADYPGKKYRIGSLFDGSGTCPLAARMCGIEPTWASEIEEYPIRVTKKNFPDMKHLGSILDINGAEIEPVDIISGGSPCQDLSVAGSQKGLVDGERSSLFFEMIRVIREMREATNGEYPRYVLWENVTGAFSSNKGNDFLEVIRQFGSLFGADVPEPVRRKDGKLTWGKSGGIVGDRGSLAWRTVDSQYWGVPQRRQRILLVVDLGGKRAGEVLFKRTGLRGNPETSGGAREGIAGGTGDGSEASG